LGPLRSIVEGSLDVNEMVRWSAQMRPVAVRREGASHPTLGDAAGAVVAGAVILVGAALALVFAATLAVVMVLAVVLFALATLAWRVRPRLARAAVRTHRRGHAWIAYGWDERGRRP
jgi:hypothetical protein